MGKRLYDKWLEDDNLVLLRGWAREGLTDEQIAKNIGVSRRTLLSWKQKFDEIKNALSRGKNIYDNEVEESLLKAVHGYYVDEVKISESEFGEKTTVTTRRYIKPDVTAIIFWLQNRCPDKWKDKRVKVDITSDDEKSSGVVILAARNDEV